MGSSVSKVGHVINAHSPRRSSVEIQRKNSEIVAWGYDGEIGYLTDKE
jgi:hypothetical protein